MIDDVHWQDHLILIIVLLNLASRKARLGGKKSGNGDTICILRVLTNSGAYTYFDVEGDIMMLH